MELEGPAQGVILHPNFRGRTINNLSYVKYLTWLGELIEDQLSGHAEPTHSSDKQVLWAKKPEWTLLLGYLCEDKVLRWTQPPGPDLQEHA